MNDEELDLLAAHVKVEEEDPAPWGIGTYASRWAPTAGPACTMAAQKIRDKAATITAHLLEVGEEELE